MEPPDSISLLGAGGISGSIGSDNREVDMKKITAGMLCGDIKFSDYSPLGDTTTPVLEELAALMTKHKIFRIDIYVAHYEFMAVNEDVEGEPLDTTD